MNSKNASKRALGFEGSRSPEHNLPKVEYLLNKYERLVRPKSSKASKTKRKKSKHHTSTTGGKTETKKSGEWKQVSFKHVLNI